MAARAVLSMLAALPLSDVMKTFLAAGHGKQTRRRNKPVAANCRQLLTLFCERPGPNAVDIRQHPAVMGRERPTEHRAEIGGGCVHDDAIVHRAYGFDRLDVQKAALNFLRVQSWVFRRIFGGQTGPDGAA